MRYTRLLGKIMLAADSLKRNDANKKFPEAVSNQILMWKMWLADYYNESELLRIQVMLMNYLEVE